MSVALSIKGPGLQSEMVEEGKAQARLEKEAPKKKHYNIQIKIKLKDDCVFKSVRAFMVLKNLGETNKIVNTDPEVRDIEDEKFDQSFTVFLTTKENEKKIRKAVESVSDVESVVIKAVKGLSRF